MEIKNTEIEDVKIIKPKVFEDQRGFFLNYIKFNSYTLKTFNINTFKEKTSLFTNFPPWPPALPDGSFPP